MQRRSERRSHQLDYCNTLYITTIEALNYRIYDANGISPTRSTKAKGLIESQCSLYIRDRPRTLYLPIRSISRSRIDFKLSFLVHRCFARSLPVLILRICLRWNRKFSISAVRVTVTCSCNSNTHYRKIWPSCLTTTMHVCCLDNAEPHHHLKRCFDAGMTSGRVTHSSTSQTYFFRNQTLSLAVFE